MLIQFLSFVTLVCSSVILSLNIKNPLDPLFYIITGGTLACILRIVVAAVLVIASLTVVESHKPIRITLAVLGLLMVSLGIAGIFANSFAYAWYGLVKPLDFILAIEIGIILNLLALEPETHTQFELLPARNRPMVISAYGLHMKKLKSAH